MIITANEARITALIHRLGEYQEVINSIYEMIEDAAKDGRQEVICHVLSDIPAEANECAISTLIATMIGILHMSGYTDVKHTVDTNCIGADKHYLKITW